MNITGRGKSEVGTSTAFEGLTKNTTGTAAKGMRRKDFRNESRGEQTPQHIDLVGRCLDCGRYDNCNRKLLEGSKQRSDSIGFMF